MAISTIGERGAIVYDGRRFYTKPPYNPDGLITDTLGAGDSFITGFITSYMQGRKIYRELSAQTPVQLTASDDEEDYCTYYSTYPLLDGDGDYSAVNREITQAALEYRDSYQEYSGGTSTLGYVTYMDEEMISIVFQHSLYGDQGTLPRVSALTLDLETGELLEPGEMITVDEELVMRFRSQNQTQNGAVAYLDNLSDEAFLSILNDPDQSFYFYSPVGLEAGFNYESEEYGSGWVSVTLKELAL